MISWTIVAVAVLNVVYLVTLPPLAGNAAARLDLPRPATLPPEPEPPEPRAAPVAPVEELREELRLPRMDETPDDEHSRASIAAYREGDYETAFEEAVLALDPAPLPENELYETLTTVNVQTMNEGRVTKPNGRGAMGVVDRALQPVLREGDPEGMAARLNNAAAMLFLHKYDDYEPVPREGDMLSKIPADPWVAEELAFQAVDLGSSYCPALLNLTLFNGMRHGALLEGAYGVEADLDHAGKGDAWANYYPEANCDEPAFLYYRAQTSFTLTEQTGFNVAVIDQEALRLADRLQEDPRWAGLAHSLKGDANYWAGVYAVERTKTPRPFTADRHFEAAQREYDAALALQPDDPAIRHGKALVYLQQGKAARRGEVDEAALNKAIEEARAALDSAPDAPRLQRTLVDAYEEKGDHAAAAELNREFLSNEQSAPPPLTVVPYSAISHGADAYSEARAIPPGGGAGGAFTDNEVIEPFVAMPYLANLPFAISVPGGFLRYLEELRHYELLRDDVLARDYAAWSEDLERAPEGVRRNERTMLLDGVSRLLGEPGGEATLEAETQAAMDAYLELPVKRPLRSGPYGSEPEWRGNDDFYRQAGNLLREHKRYEEAIRVYEAWRADLERSEADDERRAEAERLLGQARFLRGDDEGALAAFERAEDLRPGWPLYVMRQAFMHEKLADYGRAEALYRQALETMREPADWMSPQELEDKEPAQIYYPDSYQAAKHLGDVLLRQAEGATAAGEEAGDGYARAARAYGDALEFGLGAPGVPAAVNNLGMALLKGGEHERSVEVLETLVLPPPDPSRTDAEEIRLLRALAGPRDIPDAWREPNIASPPTPDENNPVFHLNLGWAHELNEEPKEAEEQYLAAIRSNPTFHPAFNDLGVLAAEEGRPEEAKAYFGAALEVKPGYAYALHNMGVTLLRSGPRGFLAGQGYLSRAVAGDPSLNQASYGYIFDNGLYFLELSLAGRVPPGWEFTENAEEGAGAVSLLALALLLGRAGLGFARVKAQETVLGRLFSEMGRRGEAARLPRLLGRARDGWFRFLGFGVPSSGGPWSTPLALLVSAPAVALVMGWGLLWTDSGGRLLMLATLFYLVVVSLLVHEAGHILAAMRFGMKTRGAPWPAGIVQALGLVAIGGPAVAPTPADLLEGGEGREQERSLVYLAGPAASIAFAVLLFAVFFIGHVPLLRLGATVNLSVAAVSLLLLPPLDGAMVGGQGRYARLLFWTGAALAVLAVVAYFGNDLFCRLGPGGSCWGI